VAGNTICAEYVLLFTHIDLRPLLNPIVSDKMRLDRILCIEPALYYNYWNMKMKVSVANEKSEPEKKE
jgi:hypothetical protein